MLELENNDTYSCVAGENVRATRYACLSRAPRSFLCRYVQAPTTQVKPEDKSVIKKTATEACEINTLKRSRPRSKDATATRTWLKSEFAF